ncbi:hypothetical protein MMC30_001726 [Trapelia coarctata]|nr:hypothetical protein [Trapelia coarctata]
MAIAYKLPPLDSVLLYRIYHQFLFISALISNTSISSISIDIPIQTINTSDTSTSSQYIQYLRIHLQHPLTFPPASLSTMSIPTTASSSSSLAASTPPTSPSSARPSSPPRSSPRQPPLSTTLASANRALLRAYNLALAYTPAGTPRYRKLSREATALAREIKQDQRQRSHQHRTAAAGAREERMGNFTGWQHRYPNFGKNDPPVMPPSAPTPSKKRDVEVASLDGVEGEVGEGGGKRVRKLSEKAREAAADVAVENGKQGGKVAAGKRRKTS